MRRYIFLIIMAFVLFAGATYEEILSDKNKQIDVFKREIEDNRNQIKLNKANISESQREIDSISTEITIINDFLKDYENETFLTPEEIANETNSVLNLEDEVNKIQDSFKNKIINLYKHGKNYELELLLSSKSANEYLRRNEYLQKFSQNRKKELRDLKSKKFILEEKKKMLSLSISSKRFYVEAQRKEKLNLENSLKDIQSNKDEAENQIKLNENRITYKENQLQIVQDFMANFTANKKNFEGNKYSRISYAPDDFAKLKGTLNLPVDLGIIKNDFGEYVNNNISTRIVNNGLDFNISKGSKVFAVSNGTVTLVGEVPFYSKVVIISHDNDYRTIYASLSEVNVNIGDIVHLNQVIGRSGETLEGQGIHFEIWQGKTPLNPKEWIRFQ
jgi:septal ring factor EnvC (AmiA/AmiB activator)